MLHLAPEAWASIENLHANMRPARMTTSRLQSNKITAGDLLAEWEVLLRVSKGMSACSSKKHCIILFLDFYFIFVT